MLGNYVNLENKMKSPVKQKTNNIDLVFKEKNEPLPQIKKMFSNSNNTTNNDGLDSSIEPKQQSSSLEVASRDHINNKGSNLTRMNTNINFNNNRRENLLQRPTKPNCNFLFNNLTFFLIDNFSY